MCQISLAVYILKFRINVHSAASAYSVVTGDPKFYKSTQRKRSLSLGLNRRLYSFLHGFWYIGLMMVRQMGRNWLPYK